MTLNTITQNEILAKRGEDSSKSTWLNKEIARISFQIFITVLQSFPLGWA